MTLSQRGAVYFLIKERKKKERDKYQGKRQVPRKEGGGE